MTDDQAEQGRPVSRSRTILRRAVGTGALAAALWSITLQLRAPAPRAFVPEPVPTTAVADADPLEVVGAYDHDSVWFLERRAAPNHRIARLDPRTGAVTTVLSLDDVAQVNGLALHPERDRLAVAFAPDGDVDGIGMAMLELETGLLEQVVPVAPEVYFLDPVWSADARLYATVVRVEDGTPRWEVVEVTGTGEVLPVVTDALHPAPDADGGLSWLVPDVDGNGRAIVRRDPAGVVTTVTVAEGDLTIDHLMAIAPVGRYRAAAHEVADGSFTFGARAEAHEGPSTWHLVTADEARLQGLPTDLTMDAVTTGDGTLVQVTRQGLWFARGSAQTLVATSRVLRFVTG